MNYLDANFATALHFKIPGQTELAEKFLRRTSLPCIFSELAELECQRAFLTLRGTKDSEEWHRLQELLAKGAWKRESVHWSGLFAKTKQLIDRFGAPLKTGTLDTLHIAQALLSGCTWFCSFDSNSNARVLARTCRLQVYPELTASEKSRVLR